MIAGYIGPYRILRKIGAGGMGLVFLGEHMLLGRRAAIKTLLPTASASHGSVERFFNEARAISAISDPGVIQIFDFGYHVDGTAYIVMELLEGEPLSARIDRLGRLALADALRLARQISGSLAVAHARKIVHRDLKPDNVFLVRDAEAQGGERTKILDFGICKIGAGDPALTQSGMMVGTPIYMSPEQCRGAGEIDHRSDIYSFGCLLFHMLTGRPPFLGNSPDELIAAHLEEAPPAPSSCAAGLPPAIDGLLLRCLAKSPEDRYPAMTELQRVLGELCTKIDGVDLTACEAPPAMPLGSGRASLYGGNFGALASGCSRGTPASVRLRPWAWPWLQGAPTPSMFSTSSATISSTIASAMPAPDALGAQPPRRVRRRAGRACVLAGVIGGLLVTSHMLASPGRGNRNASRPVARPIEAVPALPVPAASQPAPQAVAPPATTAPGVSEPARRGAPEIPAWAAQPASPREAPRELEQPAATPRPRATAPARQPPRSSQLPSPVDLEDLYDTR